MTIETIMRKISEQRRTIDVARILTEAVEIGMSGQFSSEELNLIEFAAENKIEALSMKKSIVPFEVKGETYYAQEVSTKEVLLWSGHGKLLRTFDTWQEVLDWANSLNGKVV